MPRTGRKWVAFFAGLAAFAALAWLDSPLARSGEQGRPALAAGLAAWMAIWWVTEALPIHWTACVPLVVLPFWWTARDLMRPAWLIGLLGLAVWLASGFESHENAYYAARETEPLFRWAQNRQPIGALLLVIGLSFPLAEISQRSRRD